MQDLPSCRCKVYQGVGARCKKVSPRLPPSERYDSGWRQCDVVWRQQLSHYWLTDCWPGLPPQQGQGRSRGPALLSVIVQLDLTRPSYQLKLSFSDETKKIFPVKYFLNNPANINMEGAAAGTSRETFLGWKEGKQWQMGGKNKKDSNQIWAGGGGAAQWLIKIIDYVQSGVEWGRGWPSQPAWPVKNYYSSAFTFRVSSASTP